MSSPLLPGALVPSKSKAVLPVGMRSCLCSRPKRAAGFDSVVGPRESHLLFYPIFTLFLLIGRAGVYTNVKRKSPEEEKNQGFCHIWKKGVLLNLGAPGSLLGTKCESSASHKDPFTCSSGSHQSAQRTEVGVLGSLPETGSAEERDKEKTEVMERKETGNLSLCYRCFTYI